MSPLFKECMTALYILKIFFKFCMLLTIIYNIFELLCTVKYVLFNIKHQEQNIWEYQMYKSNV